MRCTSIAEPMICSVILLVCMLSPWEVAEGAEGAETGKNRGGAEYAEDERREEKFSFSCNTTILILCAQLHAIKDMDIRVQFMARTVEYLTLTVTDK